MASHVFGFIWDFWVGRFDGWLGTLLALLGIFWWFLSGFSGLVGWGFGLILGSVHYVYLLRSTSHPEQRYVGLADDLRARLGQHNAGEVPHTAKFRPWALQSYSAFLTREQASRFERYLKSGSGQAFANRRLWPV